jgi:hypothetical protein
MSPFTNMYHRIDIASLIILRAERIQQRVVLATYDTLGL